MGLMVSTAICGVGGGATGAIGGVNGTATGVGASTGRLEAASGVAAAIRGSSLRSATGSLRARLLRGGVADVAEGARGRLPPLVLRALGAGLGAGPKGAAGALKVNSWASPGVGQPDSAMVGVRTGVALLGGAHTVQYSRGERRGVRHGVYGVRGHGDILELPVVNRERCKAVLRGDSRHGT